MYIIRYRTVYSTQTQSTDTQTDSPVNGRAKEQKRNISMKKLLLKKKKKQNRTEKKTFGMVHAIWRLCLRVYVLQPRRFGVLYSVCA